MNMVREASVKGKYEMNVRPTLLATLGLMLLAGSPVQAQQLDAEHYAKQGLSAGSHYPGLANICDISKPLKIAGQRPRGDATNEVRRERKSIVPSEPMQVFDNLYFVGTSGVASWVIKTDKGLILIDALNNDQEAERYIDAGMRQLGLEPQDIRYLIISHGHGDHYGGQAYIVDKFQPRVVMSEQEWRELEKPKLEFSNPRWGNPPKRDMAVEDGDKLRLGKTTVELYVTPGHTPGTLSMFFPVYDRGAEHLVAFWGGTGLNFGPNRARIQDYSDSAERFRSLSIEKGADIFISNHPARDGALEKMAQLKERKLGDAHSFVAGTNEVQGAFELLRDCSYAQALKLNFKRD